VDDTSAQDGSFIDNNVSALNLYLDGKLLKTLSNQIQLDTDLTANNAYVNFTSLNTTDRKLAAGANVYLEVKADFSASFSTSTSWKLKVNGASTITTKDDENNAVTESVPNTNGSRKITLASTGTLKAELLITDTKADADTYIRAGSETVANRYMGELKFTTANEKVKVKTLVLGQASSTTGADIAAIRLYDKNGVLVAQKAPTSLGHANFDALNLELAADQATSLFIGIVAKSMNADGDAAGTATYGNECVFNFANNTVLGTLSIANGDAVTAQGLDSGTDIDLSPDAGSGVIAGEYSADTVVTKGARITGSVLTSIVNAMTDAVLTNGNGRTIGKYTFVFDNGANRTTANDELKAELTTLILTISTSSANVNNIEAYIEGNSSVKTTPVAAPGATATIDLTSLGTTDLVDGTVTLVITGNVSNGGTAGDSVQTEISNLNSDFVYNGNNGTGLDWDHARLDISEVIGATLSN